MFVKVNFLPQLLVFLEKYVARLLSFFSNKLMPLIINYQDAFACPIIIVYGVICTLFTLISFNEPITLTGSHWSLPPKKHKLMIYINFQANLDHILYCHIMRMYRPILQIKICFIL